MSTPRIDLLIGRLTVATDKLLDYRDRPSSNHSALVEEFLALSVSIAAADLSRALRRSEWGCA